MSVTIRSIKAITFLIITFISVIVRAQDERAKFPSVCSKFYFEVNAGSINYPFTAKTLEDGYMFNGVKIPHAALRIIPAGYEFNKYLSAQIGYMRPVLWVHYIYSNGPDETEVERAVWMNISSVTLKPQLPLSDKFSLYGEAGLAIVTRNGFEDNNNNPVISNANYSSVLLGTGLKYNLNKNWVLNSGMVWTPENIGEKQPATSFYSAGFTYKILQVSDEKAEKAATTGYIHPKQMFQVGLTSNILGYGVNNLLSEHYIPVFWGGEAEVGHGISFSYQHNFYHGIKVLALDWGVNAAFWQSHFNRENFYTLSIFPLMRLTFLRTRPADLYFLYSIAGPTYISRRIVDGNTLGMHFTFQDYMGIGAYIGERRSLVIETKIGHYSNGDLYPQNEGVKVPLSLNIGYAF